MNCTNPPTEVPSDAGVAGAGVLLSFIVTAGLAFLLSTYIILTETLSRTPRPTLIARRLLLSFSDQQIITGIGLQSVGLAKRSSMIPYHFFLIWMLSSISTATHSASLLALLNDFKRDWVLRWLRQFLMFINLFLSLVFGVFILEDITKKIAPTLPIDCVWDSSSATSPRNGAALSIVGTIAVMVGQVLVFTLAVWYLHLGQQVWLKTVRAVSCLILLVIGMGATTRVIMLSQAFGTPSVKLSDTGEKDWSFGQLLGLLLLLLPLISCVEIYRGEMKVKSPVSDEAPLLAGGNRQSFEPNPFWNSRMRMAKLKESSSDAQYP